MANEVLKYATVIKEIYLDSFGHMNNAQYLSLFEEARWDGISKRGYGLQKIRETSLGPVMLEVTVKWLKELLARQEIVITTQVTSYEGKICKLHQEIVRGTDVCATGDFTLALFDLKARKIIGPTPDWLKAIGLHS